MIIPVLWMVKSICLSRTRSFFSWVLPERAKWAVIRSSEMSIPIPVWRLTNFTKLGHSMAKHSSGWPTFQTRSDPAVIQSSEMSIPIPVWRLTNFTNLVIQWLKIQADDQHFKLGPIRRKTRAEGLLHADIGGNVISSGTHKLIYNYHKS